MMNFSTGDKQLDEDLLTCHLYTLGVVAQLCPAITSPRIPILVQSFIATPNLAALGNLRIQAVSGFFDFLLIGNFSFHLPF